MCLAPSKQTRLLRLMHVTKTPSNSSKLGYFIHTKQFACVFDIQNIALLEYWDYEYFSYLLLLKVDLYLLYMLKVDRKLIKSGHKHVNLCPQEASGLDLDGYFIMFKEANFARQSVFSSRALTASETVPSLRECLPTLTNVSTQVITFYHRLVKGNTKR